MKNALILTADQFEDLEVFVPYFRLLEEDWHVDIASPAIGIIFGKHGYNIKPDISIENINPEDYDLLILPGGSRDGAPKTVSKIRKVQEIAKHFFEQNKIVASICHGPYTLIEADLVKNKHLTSYPKDNLPEEIEKAGGIWHDEEVVIDGNLISSRSPRDLPFFMKKVIKAVS